MIDLMQFINAQFNLRPPSGGFFGRVEMIDKTQSMKYTAYKKDKLKLSILKHGQLVPITVDKATKNIIDGQLRMQILDECGIEPVINYIETDNWVEARKEVISTQGYSYMNIAWMEKQRVLQG